MSSRENKRILEHAGQILDTNIAELLAEVERKVAEMSADTSFARQVEILREANRTIWLASSGDEDLYEAFRYRFFQVGKDKFMVVQGTEMDLEEDLDEGKSPMDDRCKE